MSESELNVDIPNEAGWPIQSVDSLCSLISRGTAPVYVEHSEVLAIGQRCVTYTEFSPDFARPHSDRAMRNVLRPEFGDVLLNSTGTGTIGRSVVFNSPGAFIVDGHVTVMRPRADIADSRWLNSVLRTPALQRHLERFCFAGSTNQLELSHTPLRESRLPTPHIDDQRAMGLVIDTLDTAIHETEAIIAKLKAVKQGLLCDLLTRGIAANGELRPPQAEAPHLYKESPLGWIPKEWDAAKLSKSIGLISGQHIEAELCNSVGKGVPYFTGPSDFLSAGTVVTQHTTRPQIMCDQADILITVKGSGCGKVAISDVQACISRQLMAIKVPARTLQYWFSVFQSQQETFNRMATGGNIPGISRAQILEMLVATPNAAEEMEVIGNRIQSINARLDSEQLTLEKLKLEKYGLMDDLLTGRVRVTPLLAEAAQQPGSA